MIKRKSINAALPRIDALRREYRTHEMTGWITQRTTFSGAYASVNDDGIVSVRVYGIGDAMEYRDYDGWTTDISDIIYNWINAEIDRKTVVMRIQEILR